MRNNTYYYLLYVGENAKMISQRMSLIPTLKLWIFEARKTGADREQAERFALRCASQLSAFVKSGGGVLFGTDAGYMTDYDPSEEYALMSKAGMTPMQILASLTTTPAEVFGESGSRGRVAAGMNADITVLSQDPADDVGNFSKVSWTIRKGRVIYSSSL